MSINYGLIKIHAMCPFIRINYEISTQRSKTWLRYEMKGKLKLNMKKSENLIYENWQLVMIRDGIHSATQTFFS